MKPISRVSLLKSSMHNKKALTLLEILVSTLILALVMTGLANIFVAGKRHILHSRSRMTGGELGKVFVEPLQMAVRQDTWSDSDNALHEGIRYCDNDPAHPNKQPGCPSEPARTLNNIVYNAQYTITRNFPIANINKVRVDITWPPD